MIKKYLKFFIGVAALILAIVVFFFISRTADLENGKMKHWVGASAERKSAAIRILTGSDANIALMVACLDKVATLPDSATMQIKDAASLCFVGIQLKENI